MANQEQIARAAGRFARKWLPVAKTSARVARKQVEKQWMPTARQSGMLQLHGGFRIYGATFLVFAAIGAFKIWQHPGALPPVQFGLVLLFILVMAGYGISSIRKARRISRS